MHILVDLLDSQRNAQSANIGAREDTIMSTVLLVVLVLLLIGALPTWPYSSGWGYYPFGGVGLIRLIVLILALTGRM